MRRSLLIRPARSKTVTSAPCASPARDERPIQLHIIRRECTAIIEMAAGIEAVLFDDDTRIFGQIADRQQGSYVVVLVRWLAAGQL